MCSRATAILLMAGLLALAACGEAGDKPSVSGHPTGQTPTPAGKPSVSGHPPDQTPTPAGESGGASQYFRGIYTIHPDGSDLTLLHERERELSTASPYFLSADSAWLAFATGTHPDQVIHLAAVDGESPQRTLPGFDAVFDMALSADAEMAFVYGNSLAEGPGVYLVTTQDGAVLPIPMESAAAPSWSPIGDRVAFSGMLTPDSEFAIYTASADGNDLKEIAPGRAAVAWAPDGSSLAFANTCCTNAGVHVADSDGVVTTISSRTPAPGSPIVWSPDGTRIAFTAADGQDGTSEIRLLDLEAGDEKALVRGSDPSWSPEGSRIAFLRDGSLYAIKVDGTEEDKVTNATQPFVVAPHWLPDGSRILFGFSPRVSQSIYVINPDGSGEMSLAYGFGPIWSPDGATIAFVGDVRGFGLFEATRDIYVTNRDGTDVRRVASYRVDDVGTPCGGLSPSWSPDSQRIVYEDDAAAKIYVATVDGQEAPTLLELGMSPAWSPDGSRIAYVTNSERGCSIRVADADGLDETNVLPTGVSPSWSPDGRRLAFFRDGGLWLIGAGTGERLLFTTNLLLARREQPQWSPDGSEIAVSLPMKAFTTSTDIFVVDAVDGEAMNLGPGRDPVWSPDGRTIAFTRRESELELSIYLINADGSGEARRLTEGIGPAWSSDGSQIAFTR